MRPVPGTTDAASPARHEAKTSLQEGTHAHVRVAHRRIADVVRRRLARLGSSGQNGNKGGAGGPVRALDQAGPARSVPDIGPWRHCDGVLTRVGGRSPRSPGRRGARDGRNRRGRRRGRSEGPMNTKMNTKTTLDRKSTRLNSSHSQISYAVFCLKKKKKK